MGHLIADLSLSRDVLDELISGGRADRHDRVDGEVGAALLEASSDVLGGGPPARRGEAG